MLNGKENLDLLHFQMEKYAVQTIGQIECFSPRDPSCFTMSRCRANLSVKTVPNDII